MNRLQGKYTKFALKSNHRNFTNVLFKLIELEGHLCMKTECGTVGGNCIGGIYDDSAFEIYQPYPDAVRGMPHT